MIIEERGHVYKSKIKNQKLEEREKISQALVILYWYNKESNECETWNGNKYNQQNPQITNLKGEYGFMVNPGQYYLTIIKDGYLTKTTDKFEIKNNIINFQIGIVSIHWLLSWVSLLLVLTLLPLIIFFRLVKQLFIASNLDTFGGALIGVGGSSISKKPELLNKKPELSSIDRAEKLKKIIEEIKRR